MSYLIPYQESSLGHKRVWKGLLAVPIVLLPTGDSLMGLNFLSDGTPGATRDRPHF